MSDETASPVIRTRTKTRLALGCLIAFALVLAAMVAVPFIRPVYIATGPHEIVIATGDAEKMERLRFGFGFTRGGEGNLLRVYGWAVLIWWNEGTQVPSEPAHVKGFEIRLLNRP